VVVIRFQNGQLEGVSGCWLLSVGRAKWRAAGAAVLGTRFGVRREGTWADGLVVG
jgi:hypothetical protein